MPNPSMFDLSGRIAIVTGGNGGIGRGLALALGQAGAAVAVLGRNQDKNQAVLKELEALGARAIVVRVDVSDRAQLKPGFEEVERRVGPVDILVNNAGIAVQRGVRQLTAQDWDLVLETNLSACFLLSQLAANSMVAGKRGGKIINITSEYSKFGSPGVPAYSASKGGLLQLTKSLAIELARHNIQVNAIVPGWITTDLTDPVRSTPFYDEIITRTPAGRFGEPEELGGAVVFLASRASNFVTGSEVFVDGGYAIR